MPVPELPDNPYISPDAPAKRDAFKTFIWSIVRVAMVTQGQERDITMRYVYAALRHTPLYTDGDRLSALYGAHWELAAYVQNLLTPILGVGVELQIQPEPARCAAPECLVNHESEAVLLEAAVRGEGSVIANVCKATVRDAKDLRLDSDVPVSAEDALAFLFMGVLQRLARILGGLLPGLDPTMN